MSRFLQTQPYVINPKVLRAYDIRGLYPDEICEDLYFSIGQCFGLEVLRHKGQSVCVGYDGRHSSPALAAHLIEGLTCVGIDVHNVGCGPSPLVYFADKFLKTDGALMVTGSHNPLPYNGLKMILNHQPFCGEKIQKLGKRLCFGHDYQIRPTCVTDQSALQNTYLKELLQEYHKYACKNRPLKVAWDPGHGSASDVMTKLIEHLPGEHWAINDTIDGSFPGHHPDPTVPDNLRQLQALVIQHACDVGIAFDGDGDRIGIIDGQGRIVRSDQIMRLFSEDVLYHTPTSTILIDVKASQMLIDSIKSLNGHPLMVATGHSNIKFKMIETGALLAGEASGHIFFADRYYGFDDALYAAVRLLQILTHKIDTKDCWHESFRCLLNASELKISCAYDQKHLKIEHLKKILDQHNIIYTDIDGVRVDKADGWWLIRASNTQDFLTAQAESNTYAELETSVQEITKFLKLSGIDPTQ